MREDDGGDVAEIVAQPANASRVHGVGQRTTVFYPGGMLKTNAGFQKVMHMHNFYTMHEW